MDVHADEGGASPMSNNYGFRSNPAASLLGRLASAAFAAVCLTCSPAGASEIARSGTMISLSGTIIPGDEIKFKEVMKSGGEIARVVRLNSGGGNVTAAAQIARMIRAGRMTTLLDGARAKCASACTIIFAGGVQRHYANADGFSDGVTSRNNFVGLGFHEATSPLALAANKYSGQGTAQLIACYYEMGVPAAAGLVGKAPPERLYRISGRTALSMGIATSTRIP
jgi:hypothetical protein